MTKILPKQLHEQVNSQLFQLGLNPVNDLCDLPVSSREEPKEVLDTCDIMISRLAAAHNLQAELYVCLLQDPKPNARAIKLNDKFIIAINSGLRAYLKNYFLHALSMHQVSTAFSLGDGECWAGDRWPTIRDLVAYFDRSSPTSIDSGRLALAEYFTWCCIVFVCLHEYGHIVAGHLNLLTPTGVSSFELDEHSKPMSDEDYAWSRQTLELDADAFAAVNGARFITDFFDDRVIPKNLTVEDFQIKYYAASFLLFLNFDKGIGAARPLNRSHPPCAWRLLLGLNGYVEYASKMYNQDLENSLQRIIDNAFVPIAQAMKERLIKFSFAEDMREWYDNKMLLRFLARWARLKPELEVQRPPSLFKLAPAQVNPA